jgi:hypothetical protein
LTDPPTPPSCSYTGPRPFPRRARVGRITPEDPTQLGRLSTDQSDKLICGGHMRGEAVGSSWISSSRDGMQVKAAVARTPGELHLERSEPGRSSAPEGSWSIGAVRGSATRVCRSCVAMSLRAGAVGQLSSRIFRPLSKQLACEFSCRASIFAANAPQMPAVARSFGWAAHVGGSCVRACWHINPAYQWAGRLPCDPVHFRRTREGPNPFRSGIGSGTRTKVDQLLTTD